MGVRILHDRENNMATLYCSTSDVAFGPVFYDSDDHDADERAEAFTRWLDTAPTWASYDKILPLGRRHDPRELTDRGLQKAYSDWLAQEADQWTREDSESDG